MELPYGQIISPEAALRAIRMSHLYSSNKGKHLTCEFHHLTFACLQMLESLWSSPCPQNTEASVEENLPRCYGKRQKQLSNVGAKSANLNSTN